MCGIAGFYGFEDKELLQRMTAVLSHRGPDQSGYYSDKNCSLGHRRLSIIDLSERGRQPISNEDGSIWVTFNGEIYNFKPLKKELEKRGHHFASGTDTEVIVHAYEEWKEKCLAKFNGDFAFVIYDSTKKSLFLARDRLGIKPLYYVQIGERLLFASEIKALLEYPEMQRKVNLSAVNYYLTFFANPLSETMFQGVYKIPPGHYAEYTNNRLSLHQYWDIPRYGERSVHPDEVFPLLQDSVKLRLMSDVPLGIYLSGGIDSGTVTALMSKVTDKINTFSVGFDANEYDSELKRARVTAEYFNTNHKEIIVGSKAVSELPKIVWHQDEPMADPTSIPTYLLSKEAKKQVTVVLTGEGADEQFAGYEQEKYMLWHQNYITKIPSPLRAATATMLNYLPSRSLNPFLKYMGSLGKEGKKRVGQFLTTNHPTDALMSMVSIFSEEEKKEITVNQLLTVTQQLPVNTALQQQYFTAQNQPFLHQLLRFENKVPLAENLLMKVDKNTMAFGIEARVPFLDHRLVEAMALLSPEQKINGFTNKYLLRKIMQPHLPKETVQRKKERFFVPVDMWLKDDLQPLLDQLLHPSLLAQQQLFNPAYIQKARERYPQSPLYYGRQLWTLLHFQMWHRMFIEKEKIKL